VARIPSGSQIATPTRTAPTSTPSRTPRVNTVSPQILDAKTRHRGQQSIPTLS